jgi:hypothetical protein
MRLRNSFNQVAQANVDPGNDDQVLRSRIEGNMLLRVAKTVVNQLLSWSRLGDTIKVYATRPQ